ncbi:uncharacterized protein LOC112575462 isoform X1 [Pomacea canaliculata]|uniref:uncharacterized protein LOC112575462 isoform X1 n=1 Tax=Pomacea canaliculata TaxID=400727 RepID=UPI000D733ABC|nr:uncharacterized protein LOC112575462 isoform X1 [Pomacea canaliculata]XP_025113125.1 uncharacterized protein LOC112575462 isoform X1 [Pomacea canaliculata]XP_025113126.1 uncharacterized protein LOC112575462 isoform X1 [Pomacea canaliculata]
MPEVTIVWCEANHLLSIQNMSERGFADTCDAENVSQKRNRTGKTCAVAECTGRNSDGISIHSFPSDPSLRKQWVQFVRVCRADFTTPTRNSVVCERHFAPECYPVTYRLMKQEGFVVRKKDLIPGSVPTIQKHAFSHSSRQLQHKAPTSCADSIVPIPSVTTVTSNSTPVVTSTVILQKTLARLYQLPGIIKPRGAYVKREHQGLSKTERKAEKNLELSIEQRNRTNNPSFPVKNNGPVRRKKLKLLPMVPEREDDIPEISRQIIKVEENSDVDSTSSISCEQGNQQYMVVAMDDLLKPYTVIHPAGSSTNFPGPVSLQRKGNNTSVRKQLQTWTPTGDRQSAEFHCTIEVKQEASSDQEEGTEWTDQLEDGAVKKEAVTEHLSPRCCPSHRTSKPKRKLSCKAVLQQPSCEVQSSSKQENSQRSKTDIQDHHINMINHAFIKKEPEDFEMNAEPVAHMGCHSSKIKTRTEMSKPRSEELTLLNMLPSDSVKKEPQDFEALWNVEMVTPKTNQNVKTKTETEIYPTGIYHNVHFAKLRSGVFPSDSAKEVSCVGDDSKCS